MKLSTTRKAWLAGLLALATSIGAAVIEASPGGTAITVTEISIAIVAGVVALFGVYETSNDVGLRYAAKAIVAGTTAAGAAILIVVETDGSLLTGIVTVFVAFVIAAAPVYLTSNS